MLTKNLLRFRRREQFIHPQFLSPRHEEWSELADSLVSLLRESVGTTQEELEERAGQLIEASGQNLQVGRGFLKLLLDRTEFEEPASEEAGALRRQVFETSSRLFAEDAPLSTAQSFAEILASATNIAPDTLRARLFSDLPSQGKALRFHDLSSESLIHRYNCAQVQGLLLTAQSVLIRLPAGSTAGLRRLFKVLRFRQLVARLRKGDDDTMEIEVEGPLSLFVQTQKYGLALASFFPALLSEKKWELVALVAPKEGVKLTLKLTEASGLRGAGSHFSAYIPEDFEAFLKRFQETVPGWTIAPADDFLPLPGEEPCFPDYVLTRADGKKVFLELFHPWHAAPLRARLRQLTEEHVPLVVGVARKCVKESGLEGEIKESKIFTRQGFLFREVPLPDEVVRRAEAVADL